MSTQQPHPIPPDGAWLGRRVSVRHLLSDGSPTDSVGDLVEDGETLLLQTRHGVTHIPRGAVAMAKVVPPRPTRPAPPHACLSIADLARVQSRHWAARDTEPLGTWLLRAHDGLTNRANSALALADPALTSPHLSEPAVDGGLLTQRLDDVQRFYRQRDLRAQLMVPVPADAGPGEISPAAASAMDRAVHRLDSSPDGAAQLALRDALHDLGWRSAASNTGADAVTGDSCGAQSALVFTAPTTAVAMASPRTPEGYQIRAAMTPDGHWLNEYRSGSQSAMRELMMSAQDQAFLTVHQIEPPEDAGNAGSTEASPTGAPVGGVRVSLSDGWGAVTALTVQEDHRSRGLGRALLAAAAQWATRHRARSLLLETVLDNETAHRLFLDAGFVPHHRYDYLRLGEA